MRKDGVRSVRTLLPLRFFLYRCINDRLLVVVVVVVVVVCNWSKSCPVCSTHPRPDSTCSWICFSSVKSWFTFSQVQLVTCHWPACVHACWRTRSQSHAPPLREECTQDLLYCCDAFLATTGKYTKGEYISEWKAVACKYARGRLLVDILAGCPVSWVDYFLMPDLPCSEQSPDEEQARLDITVCLFALTNSCQIM